MKIFRFLLGLVIGGLFIYAGTQKLLDPAAFQIDISNYQLVPFSAAGALAVYLPWLEILSGAALLGRRPAGAILLLLMTLVFTIAIASAWARGLNINCGCFGGGETATNYPLALARNFLLLAGLTTWLLLDTRARKNTAPRPTG